MSEENTEDVVARRKALGLFGLAAGAAGGAMLMTKSSAPAMRAAGTTPFGSSATLTQVPDVVAPGITKLNVGTDGTISSYATSTKVTTPAKKTTATKAPAKPKPAPAKTRMSSPDTKVEASLRAAENKKLSTAKTSTQVSNEKKYLTAEKLAQAKNDAAAKTAVTNIGRENIADAELEKTLIAQRDTAFKVGKTSAVMAPSLMLSTSDEWHLARRASLGSNKVLVDQIKQVGYSKWIDNQLDHLKVDDTFSESLTRKIFPFSYMDDPQVFHHGGKDPNVYARLDMTAGWLRQSISNRVIFESMVELWRDHLHVKQMNDKNKHSVITYDQTIREHAMDKYKDLFFHALTHPAMLHYLDNQSSRKANPNQNLGREMLELHSLGAGNHTENDVAEAARMLTGHSTTSVDSARVYTWQPSYHSTGTVKLSTGFTHPNTSTAKDAATQALKDMVYHLATRPACATKIATKLCVRFVSDNPPVALIKEMADIYLKNDTDIKPVLRALFNHKTFKAAKGAKWRRPSEVNAMMFRSLGLYDIDIYDGWSMNQSSMMSPMRSRMTTAGQEFQQWDTPDGYPDKASYWMAPSTMVAIWNMTEVWANQAFYKCHFLSWPQILGVTGQMDAWFIVDVASEYLYGMTLPYEERRAAAAYLATGDDRKMAPEWTPVTDAVLNVRLKNMMRMLFCNPRMMIR